MHDRPHLRFWCGRWYVHPDRETSFAIACGRTPLDAWMNYQVVEAEIRYRREMLAVARGGKFNMNIIIAAWRRLRGQHG